VFHKILVPVDLSNRHERALAAALELAGPDEAALVLLHVIELIPGVALEEDPDFYRALESKAEEALRVLAGTLAERRVPLEAVVLFAARAHEAIVRHAVAAGADLIVVASERLAETDAPGEWGTVSYRVGLLSSCPVLLVR
jgi:nucleotide-binding universal stress UspA family protein